MKWLQHKLLQPSFHTKSFEFSQFSQIGDLNSILRDIPNRSMKEEQSWDNGLPALGDLPTVGAGFELPEIVSSCSLEMDHSLSMSSNCPIQELGSATSVDGKRNSLKKRKSEVRPLSSVL